MITTLIFDFGGVLTTTKFFPRLAEEFGRTYHLDPELVRKRLYKHEHASLLGQESLEEFWEKTCKDLGIPLDALIHAFMSYELSPKMFAYLRMLKDKYLLVLHSDNFALRVAMIRKDPHFEIFDRMYFSNEIGMPKTTEEAFRHVLTDLGKRPEECVFIDDKSANLAPARKVGMHTILFTDFEQLQIDLEKLGI